MSTVALALYVLALVVLFGVRSWVQHHRTGSTGFTGVSGTPADGGWWGGVLFIAAMTLAQFGMVLLVPTWISAAALVALVAAVELQVRAVEEPYLLRQHGAAFAVYAARTARFVPGVGRSLATASA